MTKLGWLFVVLILLSTFCCSYNSKYAFDNHSGTIRWNWSHDYGTFTRVYDYSREVLDDGKFLLSYSYAHHDTDEYKAALLSEQHRFELYPDLNVRHQTWYMKDKKHRDLWLVDKKEIKIGERQFDLFKYISQVKAQNLCVEYYSTYWSPDFGILILNDLHFAYQDMPKILSRPLNVADSITVKMLLDSINQDQDFRAFQGAKDKIAKRKNSQFVKWCSEYVDEIGDPEQFHTIYQFVQEHVSYPDSAIESCVSGTATLDITLDSSGTVKRQKIWISEREFFQYTPMFKRECEQFISTIPNLLPASYMGEKIETHYVLKMNFALPDYIQCADTLDARAERQQSRAQNAIYTIVEQMPKFPEGEDKLHKYLSDALKYPETNEQNRPHYTVYVTFIVGLDGEIINPKVLHAKERAQKSEYVTEALRVIQGMPKWEPGKQRGKPVKVQYNLPVRFKGG